MKRIILTGGGTAGHVTPNMALVPTLKERGYDIQYIGSYDGMEKKLKIWAFHITELQPESCAAISICATSLIHFA